MWLLRRVPRSSGHAAPPATGIHATTPCDGVVVLGSDCCLDARPERLAAAVLGSRHRDRPDPAAPLPSPAAPGRRVPARTVRDDAPRWTFDCIPVVWRLRRITKSTGQTTPPAASLHATTPRHIAASNEGLIVGRPVRNAALSLIPGIDLRLHPCIVDPAEGHEKCGPRRPTRAGPSCNNAALLHHTGLATTGLSGPAKLSVEFLQPDFILIFAAICDVTTLCFPPPLPANVLRR